MGMMKNGGVGHRAWNVVRLALLWARKGGLFRRSRVAMELRLVSKYLKRSLGHTGTPPSRHIRYFERELSFDETPIFNVTMSRPSSMRFHLPHIPCIKPHIDNFDYEFNDDVLDQCDNGRKSDLLCAADDEQECYQRAFHHDELEEEEGIDKRAEEFIAKFYQQMKLQRQISYLQYNQTPNRS